MSDKKTDTGDKAFAAYCDHGGQTGMTLLDYFAGQYLASGQFDIMEYPEDVVASWAYDLAEVMIAEKRKREGER